MLTYGEMSEHLVIIGGGLAGLSAGCYARASGFRTTIVEHNLALGGVCTAWPRGGYTVDGCIHWLTGGPFAKLYEELGILPKVKLHTIDEFLHYRNIERGIDLPFTQDLDALGRELSRIAPEDATEIHRLVRAARELATMDPGMEPSDLRTVKDTLARIWDVRSQIGLLAHYRKPLGAWVAEHLRNEGMREIFVSIVPPEAPALFLLMMLGYLSKGYLSRPDGGSGQFRDALIETYHRLGGAQRLNETVDEIVVEDGRVQGVRLADGTILDADVVVSTSSGPETVLRLLGGRFGGEEMRARMAKWKLFDPVVLVSFGVASSLEGVPPTLLIRGIRPFDVGDRTNDRIYIRVYNDDPKMAPRGHTVVQVMLTTSYDWWATRGSGYMSAKDNVAEQTLTELESHLPQLRRAVQMVDVATPLTFWQHARSWRGAYEGWMPRGESTFMHVKKTLPGLEGFYMAGQWVEPGGGVPTALLSGRQVTQLLCEERRHLFSTPSIEAIL
jgi:phytoene dehydrogenase-like protein